MVLRMTVMQMQLFEKGKMLLQQLSGSCKWCLIASPLSTPC